MGSYYSELEQSLGFKPTSWTASQVHLPLSGRAEWAGELVKCCKCYVTMKIMHILCLLCSQIHIKLSAHAEMEFHCIHCDMTHRKHQITSRSREESKCFALKHAAFCDLLRALLSILVCLTETLPKSKSGVSNPAPGELPSCRFQFQPCSNTPV